LRARIATIREIAASINGLRIVAIFMSPAWRIWGLGVDFGRPAPHFRQEADFTAFCRPPLLMRCEFPHIGGGAVTEDSDMRILQTVLLAIAFAASLIAAPAFAQDPDLIFRKSTDFKLLTPNDKLGTYAIDDPLVDGVVCYFTAHEKGGLAGMFGVAEQTSDVSLDCRQYGPVKFKEKFGQGDVVFSERRSLIFKRMQIVRGCDAKRNVLVYMVYSDKLVEGSPQSSTASVPITAWGGGEPVHCSDFVRN
jgi:CreA protein